MPFCRTELSDKVSVIKGLRVKVLHLKLSYGGTVTDSLRSNLFDKVGYLG